MPQSTLPSISQKCARQRAPQTAPPKQPDPAVTLAKIKPRPNRPPTPAPKTARPLAPYRQSRKSLSLVGAPSRVALPELPGRRWRDGGPNARRPRARWPSSRPPARRRSPTRFSCARGAPPATSRLVGGDCVCAGAGLAWARSCARASPCCGCCAGRLGGRQPHSLLGSQRRGKRGCLLRRDDGRGPQEACDSKGSSSVGWLPVPLFLVFRGSVFVVVLGLPRFLVSCLGFRGGRHGSHSWESGPV